LTTLELLHHWLERPFRPQTLSNQGRAELSDWLAVETWKKRPGGTGLYLDLFRGRVGRPELDL